MLLAYYIAAVNIETTYHALAGKTAGADDYEPFNGIVLADTFQIHEADDSLDAVMFPQNNDRILTQLATPINIIVANPPYSVGQSSANDLNANVKYPTLDARIEDTYAKRSTATNKNSLYDSYVRAFRWATDRIGDTGVVAFVSNGGWIDGNTADGMRLSLADDYTAIYIYNLRGNMRKSNWKEEGGQIFGAGSQATIAIFLGVKDPQHTGPCQIFYRDIGDYLSREDKLHIVDQAQIDTLDWQPITPNAHGDWLNQRDDTFSTWPAIGSKKAPPGTVTVFNALSRGLETTRDAWVYNSSRQALDSNVRRMIDNYNSHVDDFGKHCGTADRASQVDHFINPDPAFVKWSSSLKQQLVRGTRADFEAERIRESLYRPFDHQYVYFDRLLNHRRGELESMFPTPYHDNIGFYVVGSGSGVPFSAIMLDLLPNLHVTGAGSGGQFFPRWIYEKTESEHDALDFASSEDGEVDEYGYRRVDNITDAILTLYRDAVGDQVSKDDIFYYVYGLLHDPDYRSTFAADLKKMLPHIPTPATRGRFEQLAGAGRNLADLHVNYETAEPYPLDVQLKAGADPASRETWRVQKMKWAKKKDPATGKNVDDTTTIIYNPKVTIAGIPDTGEQYLLGSRSALAWLIERYQVKTDKASGIVNDPNDWCDEHDDPTYIVELIKKVTAVSIETVKIVEGLAGGMEEVAG